MRKKKSIAGKARNTKRPAKQMWVQIAPPYKKEIFIYTGSSAKEMVQAIRKEKAKEWFIKFALDSEKTWQTMIDEGCSFVAQEETHGAFVLRLKPYKDTWEYWETLIHELHHLVLGLAQRQKWLEDYEPAAYLQEWLFQQIRRKLQGVISYKESEC